MSAARSSSALASRPMPYRGPSPAAALLVTMPVTSVRSACLSMRHLPIAVHMPLLDAVEVIEAVGSWSSAANRNQFVARRL